MTVEIGAHKDGTTGFMYLDRGYRDRGPRGMEKMLYTCTSLNPEFQTSKSCSKCNLLGSTWMHRATSRAHIDHLLSVVTSLRASVCNRKSYKFETELPYWSYRGVYPAFLMGQRD